DGRARRELERPLRLGEGVHLEAELLELALQHLAQRVVVVDEQHATTLHAGTSALASVALSSGMRTRKRAPPAGARETEIEQPWPSTMAATSESPRPVPSPGGLVVKKGSKMRSTSSTGTPSPSSSTSITAAPPWGAALMRTLRPAGLASRALSTRLTSACRSSPELPRTASPAGASISSRRLRRS